MSRDVDMTKLMDVIGQFKTYLEMGDVRKAYQYLHRALHGEWPK